MSPALAALLADGLVAGYVPILRRQVRDGVIDVPAGGIIPVTVRRDQHPLAFGLCLGGIVAILALVVVASLFLLFRAFA